MKALTDKKKFPRDKLIEFLNSLKEEKSFFVFTDDIILNCEFLLYEERDGKIVGITGIYFFPGSIMKLFRLKIGFIVVCKEFQDQTIGKMLWFELHKALKNKYNYYISTISLDNSKWLTFSKKQDYKYLGKTKDRCYFLWPVNSKGLLIYYIFKSVFDFIMPIRALHRRSRS